MLAAHYAVPFAGAVLVALNTRITPADIGVHRRALGQRGADLRSRIMSRGAGRGRRAGPAARGLRRRRGRRARGADRRRDAAFSRAGRRRARAARASTTPAARPARPKGVMYHHRGAYLQALAMACTWRLDRRLGVPVDAADVPLQRLVLHLGGDRGRRHPPVPAAGSSRAAIWRHLRERASPTSAPRRPC